MRRPYRDPGHVVDFVVAAFWCALLSPITWRLGAHVILDVDWDVVLSLVLGMAGIGYVVIDHRRTSKLDELAQSLGERVATIEAVIHDSRDLVDRVARLEATSTDAMTVEQRIASLEVKAERDEHLEERVAGIGERIAAVEATRELSERIARLEAISERDEPEETEE